MYLFFWNYDLMNFSNHIGIIGSGISGLTLAYALKKIGIAKSFLRSLRPKEADQTLMDFCLKLLLEI